MYDMSSSPSDPPSDPPVRQQPQQQPQPPVPQPSPTSFLQPAPVPTPVLPPPVPTYRNETTGKHRVPVHWGQDGSRTYVVVTTRFELLGHHEVHQHDGTRLVIDSVTPIGSRFTTEVEAPVAKAVQTTLTGDSQSAAPTITQNVLVAPAQAAPPPPPAQPRPSQQGAPGGPPWGAPPAAPAPPQPAIAGYGWGAQPPPGQAPQQSPAWGSPPPYPGPGWGSA